VLVAEGAVDISAETGVSLWDLAALQIIVTEAGGRFTDLAGHATPDGGNVICTNSLLHDEALGMLTLAAGGGCTS
jgi:histidinol-phosphatase